MIVKNLLKSSRALTAKITGHLKHLKHGCLMGCLMPVKKTFHLSMIMSWRSRGRTHVITQSPQNLKFDGICVARSTCMWAAGISLPLSLFLSNHAPLSAATHPTPTRIPSSVQALIEMVNGNRPLWIPKTKAIKTLSVAAMASS